jgi:thiamine biosynthesis lipoprotein
MKKVALVLIVVILLCAFFGCDNGKKEKYTAYYFDWFDTVTVITGYESSKEEFDLVVKDVEEMFDRYQKLYDIYTKYDGINNFATINSGAKNSAGPITVDKEIIDLIKFSGEMYDLTDGKFNIAMGSVLSIWHYYRSTGIKNPNEARLPSYNELDEAKLHTDIEKIIVDENSGTVYLADSKMTLDVGAIAKGYACEMVARALEAKGISGYVINAGGNIRTIGAKPDGQGWNVGIENPNKEDADNPYIEYLTLSGESIVTSGTYQRYYVVDGKKYHHIIDPDTLMPSERYLSLSVVCYDSGLGDALSTALFNMDFEEGKSLAESIEGVEVIWVFPDGTTERTSGFSKYITKNK